MNPAENASRLRDRIPLTPKMLIITLAIGVVIWAIQDYLVTKKMKGLSDAKLNEMLSRELQEDRIRFENYLGNYHAKAKLIVAQKRVLEYVLDAKRFPKPPAKIRQWLEPPPWMPDTARGIIRIHYALLLDKTGKVREAYKGIPEPIPRTLLEPSDLLIQSSLDQTFITSFEGVPALLSSEAVKNQKGEIAATIVIAALLNDDFIISSGGLTQTRKIVGLITGDSNAKVIASNRPDLIPDGTALDSLIRDYVATGKPFFDWGASEVSIQFTSFMPKAEFENLNRSILNLERLQRAAISLIFIISSVAIMFVMTRRIRSMTAYITRASNDLLNMPAPLLKRGDELNVLIHQFRHFTNEMIAARNAAEAANRAKSVFLANMSHELRTPLHAVLGYSGLMKEEPDISREQKKRLDIISRSGEHLLNLINNVLDISKIEAGRVEMEEADFDLQEILHEMLSMMHAQAKEKGLNFTVEQDPDLPRYVTLDKGKLRQVLINLIGNAIKCTDEGRVILRAGVARWKTPDKAMLRFEVEDSGPGIAAADRERIFLPFVRLGDGVPARAGTGLGLAISKQYVELMGGRIGVESEQGKGSLFYFEVSAKVRVIEEMHIEPAYGSVAGLEAGQPRYRILIAEDQPENRMLLRTILEPFGFDLRDTANGREAVVLCEKWDPHLIWMDVRMPVMNGLEATRRIRETEAGKKVRIIALTAHALEEEGREILAAGCDDIVRKPYSQKEIFDAMARHLGLRYIYRKKGGKTAAETAGADRFYSGHLDSVSAELRNRLHQAVIELDTEKTLALIEKISEDDPSAGNFLGEMAKALDYDGLLRFLEERGSDSSGAKQ